MTKIDFAVLAEDQNDCEVIRVLCRRILAARGIADNAWRLHARAGQGCANLRRKIKPWLAELAEKGCCAAIIVHDLDRNPLNGNLNNLTELQSRLAAAPVPRGLSRHICIPVEEIEAWFFSCERVLEKVCEKPRKAESSPARIKRPKETLINLSRGANKRPRYSQNQNAELAKELNLAECAKRCPEFDALTKFVQGLF